MPPIIHCVRHAQGYHNLKPENNYMHDPLLTPHGESECETLSHTFPYMGSVDLIAVSPLRRTIYTALLSFARAIHGRNVPVMALPDLQEIGDLACDTGSDAEALRAEIVRGGNEAVVDLSLVTDGWNKKEGRFAPRGKVIEKRARDARHWLKARSGEKEIVVVAHGGLLHYLTEDWEGSVKFDGTGWANTEFRSYEFLDEEGDDNASMRETAESRRRRKGTEKPLTQAERLELGRIAREKWTSHGYIQSM